MKFQAESVEAVLEEIKPLLVKHWEEVSFYKDIALDPDYESYLKMDKLGVLRVYTARDEDNILMGYAVFFVRANPHYRQSLQAVQDIIFIDPEKRGFGVKFILWTEKQLAAEGIAVVFQHLKVSTPHTIELFKRLSYEPIDLIMGKRLDK